MGSTKINLTSVGAALKRIEAKKEFIQTDFPEPVWPAIRTWGILPISVTIALPETSSPKETASLDLCSCMTFDSIIFFNPTISGLIFGNSIPTRALPGIGASILMVPVGAARARARSRSRAVILESLVPRATSKAYWVTAGPKLTSTTLAVMPKLSRVFSIVAAFPLISPRSALPVSISLKRSRGGYFQTLSWPGTLLTSFCSKASEETAALGGWAIPTPETLSCPRERVFPNPPPPTT